MGPVEGVYARDEGGGNAAGVEGGVLAWEVDEVGVCVAEDGVVADGVRGPEFSRVVSVEGFECCRFVK